MELKKGRSILVCTEEQVEYFLGHGYEFVDGKEKKSYEMRNKPKVDKKKDVKKPDDELH